MNNITYYIYYVLLLHILHILRIIITYIIHIITINDLLLYKMFLARRGDTVISIINFTIVITILHGIQFFLYIYITIMQGIQLFRSRISFLYFYIFSITTTTKTTTIS